jgi:hypothetical protein
MHIINTPGARVTPLQYIPTRQTGEIKAISTMRVGLRNQWRLGDVRSLFALLKHLHIGAVCHRSRGMFATYSDGHHVTNERGHAGSAVI